MIAVEEMKFLILTLLMNCTLAQEHQHHHEVDRKGDQVMGFPHDKTTHHFRLRADGGAIEVEANAREDTANRDQIRNHLRHIAMKFSQGAFEMPMLIHSKAVPGSKVMAARKEKIRYNFEELPKGGRVSIQTKDPESLRAIHEFLRFQILDHRTGDSGKIE